MKFTSITSALLAAALLLTLATPALASAQLFPDDFTLHDALLPPAGAKEAIIANGAIISSNGGITETILGVDITGEILWSTSTPKPLEGGTIHRVIPMPDSVGLVTYGPSSTLYMNILQDGIPTARWTLPGTTSEVFSVPDGLLVFYRESTKPHSPRFIALYDTEGNQIFTKSHNLNWYIDKATATADGYVAWGNYSRDVNTSSIGYVAAFDKEGNVRFDQQFVGPHFIWYAFPQTDGSVVVASNHYTLEKPEVAYFAQVNPNGILWEREQVFGQVDNPLPGQIRSMEAVGHGYWAACIVYDDTPGIQIWDLDWQCNIRRTWVEDTPEVYQVMNLQLVPHPDGVKLLYTGFQGPDIAKGNEIMHTYWKEINPK